MELLEQTGFMTLSEAKALARDYRHLEGTYFKGGEVTHIMALPDGLKAWDKIKDRMLKQRSFDDILDYFSDFEAYIIVNYKPYSSYTPGFYKITDVKHLLLGDY